jgi:hypothetical protein
MRVFERELWLRVIKEAQDTAGGRIPGVEADKTWTVTSYGQRKAKEWLTEPSKSFSLVCEMAGLTDVQAKKIRERANVD